MKQFSCGDVVPGCSAVFLASTEDDVLAKVATHAQRDHGMSQVPAELVTQVRNAIQEAPSGA